MDVLQWSRHYRLFPGQGAFDLPAFLGHVLAAGYTGPLSLEVFNDVFRQADPRRAAVDARRSLLALREATAPPAGRSAARRARRPPRRCTGSRSPRSPSTPTSGPAVAATLAALGFAHTGQHRTKPVQLWSRAKPGSLLNSRARPAGGGRRAGHARPPTPRAAAPGRGAARAGAAAHHGPAEADLLGVAAPGRHRGLLLPHRHRRRQLAGRLPADRRERRRPGTVTHVDHVALTQPYDNFDEAALFYRSLLGLQPQHASEIAAPFGLVRNRAVSDRG